MLLPARDHGTGLEMSIANAYDVGTGAQLFAIGHLRLDICCRLILSNAQTLILFRIVP